MVRQRPGRGPVLLAAGGMLLATWVALRVPSSSALVCIAPLLLAASLLAADLLLARTRGEALRPSFTGAMAVLVLLLACGIILYTDRTLMAAMLPLLGGGAAVAVLIRCLRA